MIAVGFMLYLRKTHRDHEAGGRSGQRETVS